MHISFPLEFSYAGSVSILFWQQSHTSKSLTISAIDHSSDVNDSKKQRHRLCTDGGSSQTLVSKMLGAAATAFASIIVLGTAFGLGGFIYHKFYKWLVLHKMENAFRPGDPILELLALGKQMQTPADSTRLLDTSELHWILRDEQAKIDAIVNGSDRGHYHLLIGDRGTGKLSMLLDAMHKVNGEGVSILVAHPDSEIFRVRLGRALNFEFHEDYIGSYFSMRGPRDTTALLDIERAFNKLIMVALRRRRRVGRPLVLVITSMHLLRDDDTGRDLLELLQQRAEQWAASGLVTVVFSSDHYWIYDRLKQLATRMEVTPVGDLPRSQAIAALQKSRGKYFQERPEMDILSQVYERIGGRLTFIDRVAKSADMLETCESIIEGEKRWFLNHCWILGADINEDVVVQQKYAVSHFPFIIDK
jgi:hypothetical protein